MLLRPRICIASGRDTACYAALHASETEPIYTAVTRGKKLVTIIGQPKALAMAVKNKKSSKRLTKLAARIADG